MFFISVPKCSPGICQFAAFVNVSFCIQTENGLRDNDMKPRVSEWEVIQESNMKLKPMYGPGYTGMKNLGNNCYVTAVMQAIFSIPEFQRA